MEYSAIIHDMDKRFWETYGETALDRKSVV